MKHRKLLTISAAIVAVYSEAYSQTSPFLDLTAPGDGSVAYFTGGYSGPLTSVNANSAGTIYRIGPQPATRFLSFAPPVIPAIPPASFRPRSSAVTGRFSRTPPNMSAWGTSPVSFHATKRP
jgi:hypothetical protein